MTVIFKMIPQITVTTFKVSSYRKVLLSDRKAIIDLEIERDRKKLTELDN